MKIRLRACPVLALVIAAAFAIPSPSAADETISYTYDALGRLVGASTTSGNGGQPVSVSITFDPAGNRSSYSVSGTSPAALSIGNASVTEGGTLAFPVTRSGNTAIAASASYATANGTATAGSDYTAASGTVSFAAGQTTATINVATIDDAAVEPAEAMTVTLSAPAPNTTITSGTGTGTINDNDVNPAILSIGSTSVTEGGTMAFTVTRSGNTAIAASASYATANGTATAGSDYTAASGTVSFAAGQTTATINVATIDDAVFESTEAMTVTLSAPAANTMITGATGTGTINDNDVQPATLAIGNARVTEGGTLAFKVMRFDNTAIAASASYATANGTAAAGSDYTAASGTVSFAAGQTTATINVATTDDAAVESPEAMTVTLSSPAANTMITGATGTGTIDDNDGNLAILSIGNASVTEGGTLAFTVTRSGNIAVLAAASYSTANGTATAGDYSPGFGSVILAAGQTTATINIRTTDDTKVEPSETMTVTLSTLGSTTTITGAPGIGTINDND
jgi:hypothetical protein